jgi:hypothetical protein
MRYRDKPRRAAYDEGWSAAARDLPRLPRLYDYPTSEEREAFDKGYQACHDRMADGYPVGPPIIVEGPDA